MIKKHKTIVVCAGLAVVLGAGVFLYLGASGISIAGTMYREEPRAMFSDIDGNLVNLNDVHGKPTIIYSWASASEGSRQQLTDMANIKTKYGDLVNSIAINRGEEVGAVRAFVESAGAAGRLTILLDPQNSFYIVTQGANAHETYFVNHRGGITGRVNRAVTFSEMEEGLRNTDPGVFK
ncbi:MAG: hypothetical protein A3I44_04220 [Candidatus Sungbacteria bacterium RIFCSPLOWO2_02_FULL_51_17]|uniref:Alkyl hydroperoxide reductase subunit C/ Thiol specific antioxidant domain-containing protein n=1 Tax=Candidatus Sungbacteria bacterium RIFCSPHIGHO2_02_FULL_51_29 TaxID=1802273 RepID=A0A1G2KW96_9BACT|nr:MAG: hypothetical protein A2676_02730 [Candidatus Sungbacteria bacterium RIFCSPHIGHO2_01_FULL_51_22]OHA03696.1 MAG: hypothetical protein A3C16_03610 [Candidatus Sungbacteria bacterium RIFCSPHIGHO2_02_FULL_51_29]OHA07320.1 MAG: hypothetical protein A3B29_02825 [Candidatus Sungbacteria bacterium RIFCSPLOWO2_01_FULL_51_34]OHA11283.1 MAG: hypothetical protein A3I44_04220 [Candidatus Sungbacteria bacterium RIFCSPLOWO2_02_FULL_51_17]